MAEIVVLKKWRDEHAARGAMRLKGKTMPAELHFFTGVRYERIEDLTHRMMDELSFIVDKHGTGLDRF